MLLADKICVITGAASRRGIGRATARAFVQHGARAIILKPRRSQARDAAADLGEGHLGLACNVTDKQACLNAAEQVIREFGGLTVLINNAGISQPLKLMGIQPENYEAVLDVNLRGTLYIEFRRGQYANAQPALGFDRVPLVSFGATRRRHIRGATLQCS